MAGGRLNAHSFEVVGLKGDCFPLSTGNHFWCQFCLSLLNLSREVSSFLKYVAGMGIDIKLDYHRSLGIIIL